MKKILVTGAEGFVGGHLTSAFRQRFPNADVIGTSHDELDGLRRLDITDATAVREVIEEHLPDACIHLAAISSVGQSFENQRVVWDVNLFGTLNVASALRAVVPDCRLIYPSSGEIYGLAFQKGEPVTEDETPLLPANPYAVSKAACDLALGEMALRGLHVTRLRLFNHTGPGQTEDFVLPRFAAQITRIRAGLQDPVIQTGNLDRWRDFLDIGDVIDAYVAALGVQRHGLAINICSGTTRRVGDALSDLMALADVRAEVVEQASAARPTDVVRTEGSSQRARDVLGWQPRVPWSQTLATLLAYWQSRVQSDGKESGRNE